MAISKRARAAVAPDPEEEEEAEEVEPTVETTSSFRPLPPLFREPGPAGEVIYADQVAGINVYFQKHPDADDRSRSGRVPVPNDYFLVRSSPEDAHLVDGSAGAKEWEYKPASTGKKEFERQFGSGAWYVEPYDVNGHLLKCAHNIDLVGPNRYQGQPGEPPKEAKVRAAPAQNTDAPEAEASKKIAELTTLVREQSEALRAARAPTVPTVDPTIAMQAAQAAASRETWWQDRERARDVIVQDQMIKIRGDQQGAIDRQATLHLTEVTSLRTNHTTELTGLRESSRLALEEQRRTSGEQITSLRNELEGMRTRMNSIEETWRSKSERDLDAQLKRFETELAVKVKELADQRELSKSERAEQAEKLKTERSELKDELRKVTDDLYQTRRERDQERMTLQHKITEANSLSLQDKLMRTDAERHAAEAKDRAAKAEVLVAAARNDAEKAIDKADIAVSEAMQQAAAAAASAHRDGPSVTEAVKAAIAEAGVDAPIPPWAQPFALKAMDFMEKAANKEDKDDREIKKQLDAERAESARLVREIEIANLDREQRMAMDAERAKMDEERKEMLRKQDALIEKQAAALAVAQQQSRNGWGVPAPAIPVVTPTPPSTPVVVAAPVSVATPVSIPAAPVEPTKHDYLLTAVDDDDGGGGTIGSSSTVNGVEVSS